MQITFLQNTPFGRKGDTRDVRDGIAVMLIKQGRAKKKRGGARVRQPKTEPAPAAADGAAAEADES